MTFQLTEGEAGRNSLLNPANSLQQIELLEKNLQQLIRETSHKVEPKDTFLDGETLVDSSIKIRSLTILYRGAVRFNLVPHNDLEQASFRRVLAGVFFQAGSVEYVRQVTSEGSVVVDSNSRLVDLYHKMYPDALLTAGPLGTNSLLGISVPDAWEIGMNKNGTPEVSKVYEASLNNQPEGYYRHHVGFLVRKRDFPSIFGNSQLIFIGPQRSNVPPEILGDTSVRLWKLPITRLQFRKAMHWLWHEFRYAKDSATLAEMQERAREQYQRAWDHLDRFALNGDGEVDVEELYFQRMLLNGKPG